MLWQFESVEEKANIKALGAQLSGDAQSETPNYVRWALNLRNLKWLPFVDSFRNFWAAESAEIAGLLSGIAELSSFGLGI